MSDYAVGLDSWPQAQRREFAQARREETAPLVEYVAERGNNYFVVSSLEGKDVEFSWQVSALRRGYINVRLEKSE